MKRPRKTRFAHFESHRALLRKPGKGAVLCTVGHVVWLVVAVLLCIACGPSTAPTASAASVDLGDPRANAPTKPEGLAVALPGEPNSPVPIEPDDAILGGPGALVTLVAFVDFECPFCARAHKSVLELAARYDRGDLRIVYKNNPLPFHPSAKRWESAAQRFCPPSTRLNASRSSAGTRSSPGPWARRARPAFASMVQRSMARSRSRPFAR
jgi:hypothetical protein